MQTLLGHHLLIRKFWFQRSQGVGCRVIGLTRFVCSLELKVLRGS